MFIYYEPEWMGYVMLHEDMLRSVLFARAKFLKPGGAMCVLDRRYLRRHVHSGERRMSWGGRGRGH